MIALRHQAIICVSANLTRLKTIERLLVDSFGKQYVIEIAESSMEVLDIMATLNDIGIEISLLVIDNQISDMRGLELTHLVNQRNERIKTMLMTEEADLHFAQQVVNVNDVYALVKLPLDPRHFLQLIGNATRQYDTDKKLSEIVKRLRISESEKSLILESISEAIVYVDMSKHVLWKNGVAERELSSENKSDAAAPLMETICEHCDLDNMPKKGSHKSVEITFGKRRFVVRYFPTYDRDELPSGMVITMLDNTEWHKAVDMNKSLLEMSRFVNNSDAMVLIYNKAFHLIDKYFEVSLMCMTGEDFDSDYVEFYSKSLKRMEQPSIEALIRSVKRLQEHNEEEQPLVIKNEKHTIFGYPMKGKLLILALNGHSGIGPDGIEYLNIIAEHVKMGIVKVENHRRILYQQNHDGLTGLFSRSYFLKKLENYLDSNRKRHIDPGFYSIAVMDLNYFKDVNDNLSHLVGDEVLLEIAQRLRQASREGDVVARIGGDEFAVLFQTGNKEEIIGMIERLQEEVSQPITVDDIGIQIGSSFGIVHDISNYSTVDRLMSDANQAMYEAKKNKSGNGTYVFFEKSIQSRIERMNAIEKMLKTADYEKDFRLDYQPIVNMGDRSVVGYEGFVRWEHGEVSPLSTEEWIQVAESNGSMLRIGDRLVEQAFDDLETLSSKGIKDRFITVNMTSGQMSNDDHIHHLKRELLNRNIQGNRFHVDVTDRFRDNQTDKIVRNISDLREYGIQVDLDDFGRGQASLNTISRLGVDVLKVDRQMVNKFRFDSKARTMIQSIISIAKSMGLKVIAEGIEKEEEFTALKDMGCDYGQGYYFMKPDSLEKVLAYK